MLSHETESIYIHIPRAAGTSLIRALGGRETPDCSHYHDSLADQRFAPPPPHLRAYDYVRYGHVTPEQYDRYFKYSFVRNPWDRLVSEYKYRRNASRFSFREFVLSHFPRPSWTDEYCHVIPQVDFLCDEDGQMLVDFVGRFESLPEDFKVICSRLGLEPRALPRLNRSRSVFRRDVGPLEVAANIRDLLSPTRKRNTFESYTDYYDEETRQFVADFYRRDVETFGYEFEGSGCGSGAVRAHDMSESR